MRTPLKADGLLVELVCLLFVPAWLPSFPQAQLIAQSIGQAFSVAYQEFLRANGINPEDLSQKEYSDIINTQEMYNDDLIHFSNSENCKEVSYICWGLQDFLCLTLPALQSELPRRWTRQFRRGGYLSASPSRLTRQG